MALTIFYQLTALLAMAGVGWVLAKLGKLREEASLNALLVNAALPAMVINTLQAPYSVTLLKGLGIMAGGMMLLVAAGCLAGVLAVLLFKKRGTEGGAWIAGIAFPNTVYMGQPLVLALFGEEAMPLMASVMLVFNLTSFIIGGWLVSRGVQERGTYGLKSLLLKPAVFCCFLGLALYFMPFRLPLPVQSSLGMLAHLNTPISMVVIGCQLARCNLREIFLDARIYIISFFRLIAAPLLLFAVARLVISDPMILGVLMIAGCMPSAAIVPVLAQDRGGDALLCSKVTFTSTLLCVVTVPLLLRVMLP